MRRPPGCRGCCRWARLASSLEEGRGLSSSHRALSHPAHFSKTAPNPTSGKEGMVSKLHNQLIVVDGLIISNFGRSVFEDMRRGGITAANCTSSVWENFAETMRNTAKWKIWLRENADLITQVYTTAD